MEVLHDLVGYQQRKIYQDTSYFAFSLDSILLPRFVTLPLRTHRILDLGTGTAAIPLVLSTRTKCPIVALEIQEELALLATKSVVYNQLEQQIEVICQDMKEYAKSQESDSFDVITVNPPYFKTKDESFQNENIQKRIARHEVAITLEEILGIAKKLLKMGGILAMVHRTDRLLELLELFQQYGIEPKRLQFVYPKVGQASNMVLLEGIKRGKPGLKIEFPVIVHQKNGEYTEEVKQFFE